ncbi:hypothetical protein [Marinomonas ostreistagni]|uniref:hypothetical protein n=1 Tax=Marinomonas ostreistagni TaxID=359209 RepID=UPI001951F709|nr:hypothetical protein [Marinomonas ostreistagni]MBM6551854.1 hypothetical protein [Marinomonas ostreistagni]
MNFKTPALIAALALTATTSFASSDENNLVEDYLNAQAHVKAISAQLESMGVEHDANVEFNNPTPLTLKLDAYEDKLAELQSQFDVAHNTVTTEAN